MTPQQQLVAREGRTAPGTRARRQARLLAREAHEEMRAALAVEAQDWDEERACLAGAR